MKVKFEATFAKDLRAIRDRKILNKIKEVIEVCQSTSTLTDIPHLKKMQGYDHYYRLRLADYRIGIERIGDTLVFTRCLHRKDIYKYFP